MLFEDKYRNPNSLSSYDAIQTGDSDLLVAKFKGYVKDVAIHADGTEELLWEDSPNIVVLNASVVIAALIAGLTNYFGATWWAIGTGNASWDTTPATPANTDSALTAEVYRKSIPNGSIQFLDTNNNVVAGPTNTTQIQLTFGTTEANNQTWREFAIYGGNATATAGSGLMINHKIHPAISKTSAISIQRTLRLSF